MLSNRLVASSRIKVASHHRLELAVNTGTDAQYAELKRVAPAMLEEWSVTKKAPRHAAWLHEAEFDGESE